MDFYNLLREVKSLNIIIMKKFLLSAFALLAASSASLAASTTDNETEYTYKPLVNEGVTWSGDMKIRHNIPVDRQESYAYTIELKGDTVINNLTYKKCYYHFFNLRIYDNSTLRGFLREDIDNWRVFYLANKNYTPKVKFNEYENPIYRLDDEILLYDFANINNPQQYWLANAGDRCGNIITVGPRTLNDGVSRLHHSLVGGYIIEGVGFREHKGHNLYKGHDLINVYSIDNYEMPLQSYPMIYAMHDANGNIIYNDRNESNYMPLAIEGNKWMCGKVDVTAQGTTHTPFCYVIKGDKEVNGKTYKCCYKLIGDDTAIDESNLYALLRDDNTEHKTFVVYPESLTEETVLYDFYNPLNSEMLKHFGYNAPQAADLKIEEFPFPGTENRYRLRLSAIEQNLFYIEGVGFDGTQKGDLFNVMTDSEDSYTQFYELIDADGNVVYTSPASDPTIDYSEYVPLVKEGVKWECNYRISHWYSAPCETPYTIEIKGDTIIGDIAYKCCVYTFKGGICEWDGYVIPADTLTLAFIREDVENKKVYARFNDSVWHDVYCQNGFYHYDVDFNKDFLLYDFAYINNPEQAWQITYDSGWPQNINTGKIIIDGVERNCYSIGNGNAGYIIEGIGYDGYGFNQNAGDLMCQFPVFLTGDSDVFPVFKAYKNAEGKTVYNTGDAAKGFSGIYGIATDNEESIFHIANGTIAVNGEALIEIIDLNGRKVASAYCDSFSTETLPKGMYIIRATTQSTTQTHKVIVK